MNITEFEQGRVSKVLDGSIIVANWLRNLPGRYVAYNARKLDENRSFYIKDNSDFERMQRHALFYLG